MLHTCSLACLLWDKIENTIFHIAEVHLKMDFLTISLGIYANPSQSSLDPSLIPLLDLLIAIWAKV